MTVLNPELRLNSSLWNNHAFPQAQAHSCDEGCAADIPSRGLETIALFTCRAETQQHAGRALMCSVREILSLLEPGRFLADALNIALALRAAHIKRRKK